LALRSEPTKGSRFTVFLPLLEGEEIQPESETAAFLVQPETSSGAVLLVDDEASVRDVSKRLLEREGVRVMVANDGAQAVSIFKEYANEIALVLMDLTMPEMDGEEAFHAMRAIRPDVMVVLSSGFLDTEAVERLRGNGLAGFVKKPYTRQRLLIEMNRFGIVSLDL